MIVRISGPSAHLIASRLTEDPLSPPSTAARLTLSFNNLTFPAWLYIFSAPRSYTTEDLIEFHIPGNPLLARLLLDHLITLGARHADPGEFTARGYFAGRLDLSEAEGVAATIAASNEDELRAAGQLLAGELSKRLRPMMDNLAETLALIEVGIDFSDEDVTFLPTDEIRKRLTTIDAQLNDLITTSSRFDRLSHEPHFVLVGRPNAGKSTLLNTLAGHTRAIVSPIPGTTRDPLSAHIRLKRGLIRLTDVAGLDEPPLAPSPGTPGEGRGEGSSSPAASISHQMQTRHLCTLESADHILLLHDITDPRPLLSLPRNPDLLILTKSDLALSGLSTPHSALRISSQTGSGLTELRETLDTLAFGSAATSTSLALTARHLTEINEARSALNRALSNLHAGSELVALDLRESLDALGQILGSVSPDDLLGKIFSTFCIGK